MRTAAVLVALVLGPLVALLLAGKPVPTPAPDVTPTAAQQPPTAPALPTDPLSVPSFPTLPLAPPTLPTPRTAVPAATPPKALPTSPPAEAGRTSVKFVGAAGVRVSWQTADGTFHDRDLIAPATFNFVQGRSYRLRLADHPRFPERSFYPSLEVAPPSDRTRVFVAHCAVPVAFTDAELVAAAEGKLVVKTVFLPVVSGRQDGDAVQEVSSVGGRYPEEFDATRGTKLAVVRLGSVELETPTSPPLSAPPTVPDVPPGGLSVAPAPRPR